MSLILGVILCAHCETRLPHAANATLSQLATRACSGIRGFFGSDSDEYERAGACGAYQRAQEAHPQSEGALVHERLDKEGVTV